LTFFSLAFPFFSLVMRSLLVIWDLSSAPGQPRHEADGESQQRDDNGLEEIAVRFQRGVN
jgi:hypothetical protein